MTEDVIAVLDHLAIASSHLVGWSDGGITGLLMAIGHPGRIGRMMVIGANFHPEGITIKERKAIRETSAEKAHPVLRFLYAVFSPTRNVGPGSGPTLKSCGETSLASPPRTWQG